ncbi:MAG: hypothetical protein DRN04_08360 [Thermoprotei archaeon]|nr:MAG: hypothetical protein DRN04_08360 [Thermoprotei archaeon]
MTKLAIHGGEPVRKEPFPLYRDIGEEELKELKEVIESKQLFRYGGTKVKKFEEEFAKFYGVKHAVACTSGTAAIHIALGALELDAGSEVITSPITDMGTIIPILAQNCIPIFADLDPYTYTLDPRDIEKRVSEKTKAIIAVHLFGYPCDMDPIMEIAEKHGLYVIEDCCQAYLAEYKGRRVGTIGHINAFSLQMSKHMTTGDGGITVTNDDELGRKARLFMDKGWVRDAPSFARTYVMFGFNYRMNELTGAVALAQLKKLPKVVEKRRMLGEKLTKLLEDLENSGYLYLPKSTKERKHSFWLYPIKVNTEKLKVSNIDFAKALSAEGIPASAGYIGKPLYTVPYLMEKRVYGKTRCPFECPYYGKKIEYKPGLCPNVEKILAEIITVPINEHFSDKDVEDIAEAVRKVTEYYAKQQQP